MAEIRDLSLAVEMDDSKRVVVEGGRKGSFFFRYNGHMFYDESIYKIIYFIFLFSSC